MRAISFKEQQSIMADLQAMKLADVAQKHGRKESTLRRMKTEIRDVVRK